MKITEDIIPHINLALNINLHSWQIDYLIQGDDSHLTLGRGRGTGKTLVHIIRLVLSDGEPLNMRFPERFSDYGDGSIRYARDYYKRQFWDIHFRLKNYGFKTRELIGLKQ